jgi:hypothetical protein
MWGRKSIVLLEVSQASPASPSDYGSVEMKTLGWLEKVARDMGRGILIL